MALIENENRGELVKVRSWGSVPAVTTLSTVTVAAVTAVIRVSVGGAGDPPVTMSPTNTPSAMKSPAARVRVLGFAPSVVQETFTPAALVRVPETVIGEAAAPRPNTLVLI